MYLQKYQISACLLVIQIIEFTSSNKFFFSWFWKYVEIYQLISPGLCVCLVSDSYITIMIIRLLRHNELVWFQPGFNVQLALCSRATGSIFNGNLSAFDVIGNKV